MGITAPGQVDRRRWLLAGGLVVLVLVAYVPVLCHGGYIWDDDFHVTNNVHLRSFEGLWRLWTDIGAVPQYYPLTHTTFWLEYHLWGDHPAGYHLVNVLLHAGSALLLWRILTWLGVPGAWVAAAIFAVHPVHVESVAWITERKNTLSALLYLSAMCVYLRLLGRDYLHDPASPPPRWRWDLYAAATALFMAALLSKTVTSSLPAAILLIIYWKRGRLAWRTDVRVLAPWFVIGALFGLLTGWMERHVVGAIGPAWDLHFYERVLIAGRAVWFYAWKLIWPTDLTFIYERWVVDAGDWRWWAYPLSAGALVAALALVARRIGRGPLVAVLFFGGTLVPALGFVNVYPMRFSFVADHFQYLASIGLIVLIVATIARLLQADRAPVRRYAGSAAVAAVLLALGVLTWRQGHIYQDEETLWRDTLANNHTGPIAPYRLGYILFRRGELDQAEELMRESLQRDASLAPAALVLGHIAEQRNQADQALEWYRQAVQIHPPYPEGSRGALEKADYHFRLAYALAARGQAEEAAEQYEAAVRINPAHEAARMNLANLYNRQAIALFQLGQVEPALKLLGRAIEVEPQMAETYNNRGTMLRHIGRPDAAMLDYREALRLRPGWEVAQRNLQVTLQQLQGR